LVGNGDGILTFEDLEESLRRILLVAGLASLEIKHILVPAEGERAAMLISVERDELVLDIEEVAVLLRAPPAVLLQRAMRVGGAMLEKILVVVRDCQEIQLGHVHGVAVGVHQRAVAVHAALGEVGMTVGVSIRQQIFPSADG
jgi:hypothetical protein